MRVLWVVNKPIPAISEAACRPVIQSIGWLVQMGERLSENAELTVIFPADSAQLPLQGEAGRIHYVAIKAITLPEQLNQNSIDSIKAIISSISPDIIQIWGTEYLHPLAVFRAVQELGMADRTLVYLQGILSVIKDYYWAYITDPSIRRPTLKDRIRKTGPNLEYQDFLIRSRYEEELLKQAVHVIGRTAWDRESVLKLNPNVHYHLCNETLRPTFYQGGWDLTLCEQHRVFVSQGYYPLKGLHLALKGISLLRDQYPDIRLYCTGKDLTSHTLHDMIRETRYERYIRQLIDRYQLKDHVVFTGNLDAEQMKEQYLKAHVFLSASSIENSPNSIGEAMILGTPVVASDVGGVSSMLSNEKEGLLYQADRVEDMAADIDRLFRDNVLARRLSAGARERARITHDPETNYRQLISIYEEIARGTR